MKVNLQGWSRFKLAYITWVIIFASVGDKRAPIIHQGGSLSRNDWSTNRVCLGDDV